jgi:membrane protein DedA with SNARE-associated domain
VIAITESRFLIGLAAAEPSLIHNQNLHEPIATYGSWAVGIIIGLESMGLPLPGETALVLSALYAHKHQVKFKRSHRQ